MEVGDQLGEQLGVPNANQQDEQNGIPIFSPGRLHGHRPEPLPAHPAQGEARYQYVANLTYAADKHTIKAGFDIRRRHMSEFQTNRGQRPLQLLPQHHQQPREQHAAATPWPRSCSARPA